MITGLRVGHKNDGHVYNHTLAKILVEYASAVSLCSKSSLMRNTWIYVR